MLALNYNKLNNVYEIWKLRMCQCGGHYCKDFQYASSDIEDCIQRLKGAMEEYSSNLNNQNTSKGKAFCDGEQNGRT